ncbi:MAG TPA: glycosyltransferase family 4 protein [Ferruginibacter sp.]|nr:glycosyltransferase family 4 protein [Ferruginibacter sp.]
MKIISTSYINTPGFSDPQRWLDRISFYTGILEEMAKDQQVESIEQIRYSGILKHRRVTYHFLNFKKSRLHFPGRLHTFIKKLNPDVVLVNGLIFPAQVIQLRLKLGKRVKIILLHRGEKPYRGVKRLLQKLADSMVDAYLFTSAEFGNEWMEFGNISDENKVHEVIQASSVFHVGDSNAARTALHITGSPVFLWVGRLNTNKDPLTIVKAFLSFVKFQPGAKLYMIYQTDELLTQIKDLIASKGDGSNAIELVGRIPHAALQNWYNAADFIISGSHHEGSGIAVCEGMSCGCIPLVTDIISFRKMTGPGKCGLVYEPGNDAALLKILMQMRELDMEMEREKTLEQFNRELSFPAVAKKIHKIINKL